MDDTLSTDNAQKITAFSKRFYTLRATSLLKELINIINDFDGTQQNLKILAKIDPGKRQANYLSNAVLTKVNKFSKRAKYHAEKLLQQLTDGDRHYPPTHIEQDYIDHLTLASTPNNPEKRAEIEQLLNKYAPDLAEKPDIYTTRLMFAYDPSASSPSSSSAFNNNIDTLRKNGIINLLSENTLLYNQSFDVRQLLTFDDYRLYLLQYYFSVLRRDLSSHTSPTERHDTHHLTPFDLLFNPQLEITYSPKILAILHFRHHMQLQALTDFIVDIKEEARRLLNESGELIYHIDARINALKTTLSPLKSRQHEIESTLNTQMQSLKHSKPPPKRQLGGDMSRRTAKVQAEINALKRQRTFIVNNTRLLNDYQRIVKLYVEAERNFLHDLADYLLTNKTDSDNTAKINALRKQIQKKDLTIQENHHQFRVTEKKDDTRFREKPFDAQNNQYTNYRKLWMDIIDNMFNTENR